MQKYLKAQDRKASFFARNIKANLKFMEMLLRNIWCKVCKVYKAMMLGNSSPCSAEEEKVMHETWELSPLYIALEVYYSSGSSWSFAPR